LTLDKHEIFKNMVKSKATPKQIAASLNISLRTAQRWTARYEQNPDLVVEEEARRFKDKSALKENLSQINAADQSLTILGMIERLPNPLKCSPSTASRTLKAMNYSRKRLKTIVAERNSERVIASRATYAIRLQSIQNESLVFIDESGFNLHTSPTFGYAPIGSTPWLNVPTQRGRNISLIAATTLDGLVAHQTIIGAYNTVKMGEWCQQILLPALGHLPRVFVLDNASFHHSQLVADILSASGSQVLFLPPYSPQLNPIEQVFAQIKARYRSHQQTRSNSKQLFRVFSVNSDTTQ
jgi:transposase